MPEPADPEPAAPSPPSPPAAPPSPPAGARPPERGFRAKGGAPASPTTAGAPLRARAFGRNDNALSAGSPFATDRDRDAVDARAPLERRLLGLNLERDELATEIAKMPPHARSFKEKQRRRLAEDRKADLDAMANQLKFALRATAVS